MFILSRGQRVQPSRLAHPPGDLPGWDGPTDTVAIELLAIPAGDPAARPLFVEPLRPIVLADMVKPGQTAIRLFDRLQVVATVRESLATSLQVGQQLPVILEALDLTYDRTPGEILPETKCSVACF